MHSFGKHPSGSPSPAPAPPSVASSGASTAQSLLFRKVVASKRGELCMHFVSPSGCALGPLCPYRHAGAQRTATAATFLDGDHSSSQSEILSEMKSREDTEEGVDITTTVAALHPSSLLSSSSKRFSAPPQVPSVQPLHMTISPLYSQPLCAHARGLVLWFFAELPAVTNSAKPPRWTAFDSEWTSFLEQAYLKMLKEHQYHRNMPATEFKEYTIEFARLYMCRTSDKGSRRPIQRALITASPTWVLEELDAPRQPKHHHAEDESHGDGPVSEVIDPVASSCLEYHYVHGGKDLLTIDVNRWKLRINLLTMVGREVREKRRSMFQGIGDLKDRFRTAASVVVNSGRFGGRPISPDEIVSPTTPSQRSAFTGSGSGSIIGGGMSRNIIHRPSVTGPRPPTNRSGSSTAATTPAAKNRSTSLVGDVPAKRFQLRRLPITVRHGCPPSDPFDTSALQVRLTVVAKGTNKPIQTVIGPRPVRGDEGDHRFVFPVALDLNELTAATLPDVACDALGQCHWESGHHLWTHAHRCPAGRSSNCFLCSWTSSSVSQHAVKSGRSPSTQSSGHHVVEGHRDGSHSPYPQPSASTRGELHVTLDALAERSEVHRQLMSHEGAPIGSAFDAARSAAVSGVQAATGPWRRHQAVSRWFRSEWDGGRTLSVSTGPATNLLSSGLLSVSAQMGGVATPHSVAAASVKSPTSIELHHVKTGATSHEVLQLLSLMQRNAHPGGVVPTVASRRRSIGGASLLADGGDGWTTHPTSMGQSLTSSAFGTPAPVSPMMRASPNEETVDGVPSPNLFRQSVQQLEKQHALAVEQCYAARSIRHILVKQTSEGDRDGPAASHTAVDASSEGSGSNADETDLTVALHGLQIQRVQHHAFYSRYLRSRTEMFTEWHDSDAESAESSREEALFRYIPRSWLRSILYQEEDHQRGSPPEGVDDTGSDDMLRSWNQQRMHFYRDLEAAGAEQRVPGVPYLLLVVVAFPGAAIRLANPEALQLVAAPLVVPWHINTASNEDQVRRYQTYHAVVCDEGSTTAPAAALNTSSSKLQTSALGIDAPFTSTRSPSRSPRHHSGRDATSPRSTTSSAQQLSATAKKVFLYDPTQWCPMYLMFV